jgi:hypothetical protein
MSPVAAPLPIDDVLGALRSTFAAHSGALLIAPPGAGETTRAALAPFDEVHLYPSYSFALSEAELERPRSSCRLRACR